MGLESAGEAFVETFITDNADGGGAEIAQSDVPRPSQAELTYASDGMEYLRDIRYFAQMQLEFIEETKDGADIKEDLRQLIRDINEIERRGFPRGEVREVVNGVYDEYSGIVRQIRYT